MDKEFGKALKELRDEDVEKRLKAVEKLAQARDKKFVQYLVESLGDVEWRVRKSAVSAIINSEKDAHLIEQLISIFYTERNIGKKNAAAEALIGLGESCLYLIFSHLSQANREAKKFLVEVLGEINSHQATFELIKLLKDPDENVCLAAIDAVGKLRDHRAVEALFPLLRSESPLIRFATIKALERIGDPRAVESIAAVMNTKGLERAALEALGTLGDPKALNPVITAFQQGPYKIKESAIKSLIQLHERTLNEWRAMIINRIRKIYNKEIGLFLMEVLQESDDKGKLAAIKILGWVKESNACALIARFLNSAFRDEAIRALVEMGHKAVQPLIGELPRGNETVKEGIAKVLGEIGDRSAAGHLIQLLTDPNGHVREAAALALGKIKDPSSARAILDLLTDQYVSVQESALEALVLLHSPFIVSRLLELLTSEKPSLRNHAVRILGKMKAVEAIPKLSFAIKDEEPQVRRVAIEALGSFETPEINPLLILGLADEDQSVRLTALSTIVKRQGIDLFQHIDPLLTDENIWVRTAAVRALGEQGGETAQSLLIGMLKDKVGIVQIASIESLAKFHDPGLYPLFYEFTKSHDVEVIKAAITAIGDECAREYGPQIQLFLNHPDWSIRATAAQTLGKLRDHSAKNRLERMVSDDPDRLVKQSAQFALAQLSER